MSKKKINIRKRHHTALALFLTCTTFSAAYAQQQYAMRDFLSLSIEELSRIKITSVSKQEESLSDAAASIYVITRDDIRSSGATTIPEALRLAPNLQVARAGSGHYAISARGFNNAIGNKLLVLIDGRTVYSPVFSGVFWDQQDVMLEDVERIEVISGPGGTLWGSNAVNGVINIITRSTADTEGALATIGGGNLERGLGGRYGGALGDSGHFRVYAKGMESDQTKLTDDTGVNDAFERTQAGFRFDWNGGQTRITLQGDAYDGEVEEKETSIDELKFHGGNILGRYTRRFDNDSELTLQTYADRAVRENDNLLGIVKDEMKIFDAEIQYALPVMANNRILFGGGYRKAEDRMDNGPDPAPVELEVLLFTNFLPDNKDLRWRNFFIQDEIELPANHALTLGGKWEENIYTGREFLPSIRWSWQPQSDKLLWTSTSRAIRAPARLDRDFYLRAAFSPILQLILGLPPNVDLIAGGPHFESEISDVAELGWRDQPSESFSYSVTAFYAEHDKQRSGEPDPNDPLATAFLVSNTIDGSSKGLEAWANYQVGDWWLLSAGLMELRHDLQNKPGSLDPTGPIALGNDPKYTGMLRSTFNINNDHQLHIMARHVGKLPAPEVPSFTAVDMNYIWQAGGGFELSLLLQNMFDTGHVEFYGDTSDTPAPPIEYERGAFLKLTWTN